MWNQSGLGLQPQSLHFTICCCLGLTQNSSSPLPKAWSAWAAVMWWGHIPHPYAHPQHKKVVKHLCICLTWMWDQSGLGLQPQSPHFTFSCYLGVIANSRPLPKAWSAWAAVMWWWHIHMHIHSIWRLSNTSHMLDIDVKSIWIGSTASITALHHQLLPGTYPEF